ncbi:MAG: Rpp14/Pop5 family protein [Candidatus Bathyarchaeia archaeon]
MRIMGDKYLSEDEFASALMNTIKSYFGLIGSARTDLRIINFEPSVGEAILKCRSNSIVTVRSAITLLTHIGDKPAAAFVTNSSGTIRNLRMRSRKKL